MHTAKLAASMGTFLFRGLPARIPMFQLARSKANGGLNLHLPAIKSKSLFVNRYIHEMNSMPFYRSLQAQNILPTIEFPCLRLLTQQLNVLSNHLTLNPTSGSIHLFYLDQTEVLKVERNTPGLNWKAVWRNISSRRLSSK